MEESIDIEDLIGRDNSVKNADFVLLKTCVDRILDELEENLKLFFRVMVGFRNMPNVLERRNIWVKLSTYVKRDIDVMIHQMKQIHTNFHFSRYKILQRYQHILKAMQHLRGMVPRSKQTSNLNKRKKTLNESLQWITETLANKARNRNLTKKIHVMQSEIDETKLELLALKDRSSKEIKEITEKSELKLFAIKKSEDERFSELQEEASKLTLDLDQMEEYRDLLKERDQKRRKIVKMNVQLQQGINQYDKFVGEPMKELMPIEEEAKQFAEWKEAIFYPQKEKLEQLKGRIETWKTEQLNAQVEQFRIEHAARVLQRAWRKVLEKRRSKKKGKKGKKGKKRIGQKKK